MSDLNHYKFLMHSPSKFTTLIICYIDSIKITSNTKVRAVVFPIECNVCIISIISYCQCTQLQTSPLSFIFTSIQLTIVDNSKVRAVVFWLNVFSPDFNLFIFFLHSLSYYITLINSYIKSIKHHWQKKFKSTFFSDWMNF